MSVQGRSTTWLAGLRPTCGALVPAAEACVAKHLSGECPAGVEGIRRLASLVERWADADDVSEADDLRFVQEAGALLGLLLAQHVAGAVHLQRDERHRLRLGRFGCFDPFSAIERAIEDPQTRQVLIREVSRAEAEAEGQGPVARLMLELERQLELAGSPLTITDHFDRTLWLGPDIEIDLSQLVRATQGLPLAGIREPVARLLAPLLGRNAKAATLAWDQAGSKLLPRLVGPGFRAQLHGRMGALSVASLVGELRVALVLDHGDRARYVRVDELSGWRKTHAQALAIAVDNLAERWQRARYVRQDTPEGPMLIARSGDGLDASRLLLPAVHGLLAAEFGPGAVAGVPHRDLLLACKPEPALVRALQRRTAEAAARAPHGISKQLLRIRGPGLLEPL